MDRVVDAAAEEEEKAILYIIFFSLSLVCVHSLTTLSFDKKK